MDGTQALTIIGTTLSGTFAFYLIIRDDIKAMDNRHREDVNRIEEKWERLFEKIMITDKK